MFILIRRMCYRVRFIMHEFFLCQNAQLMHLRGARCIFEREVMDHNPRSIVSVIKDT